MKRLILMILMSAAMQNMHAQNNRALNPGFENSSGVTTSMGAAAINTNLNDWKVYFPTCNSGDCWQFAITRWFALSDANGNNFYSHNNYNCGQWGQDHFICLTTNIHLGASPIGATCNCNRLSQDHIAARLAGGYVFNTNQWYVIRYKMVPLAISSANACTPTPTACAWTLTYDHLRVFASVGGPTTWLNSNNTVEELYSANWQGGPASQCDWRVIERRFQVTTPGLTTLAFLAETGAFFLDDIEVFEECDNNYLIQNKSYTSVASSQYVQNGIEGANFKEMAGTNLTAGANVGGTSGTGDVVVGYDSYVIYTAANSIKLKGGFKAQNGSHFHAVNAGCTNNVSQKTSFDRPNKTGQVKDFFPKSQFEGDDHQENSLPLVQSNIYPNPVKDKFSYTSTAHATGNRKFVITNILNQEMYSQTVQEDDTETTFDISGFQSGVYFLNEYDHKDQRLSVARIIKE